MSHKTSFMILRNIFIALLLITTSCGLVTKKNTDPNLRTVSFNGTVHKPYCGGAKPSPDVAAGYYESMKFEKFKIIKGAEFNEGLTVYEEVTLDVEGNATFHLEKGPYMLVRADKFLPLDEFMKKNGLIEEKNYELKGNECFKTWQNTVDLYFNIENDTILELRQNAKCWVGTNPCMEYVGPPAP